MSARAKAEKTAPMTDAEIQIALGTERWVYIAVGPNCWGKAFDADTAVANAKRERPRHLGAPGWKHILFAVADPWAYIDEMGDICYTPRTTDATPHREWVEVDRRGEARR